MRAAYYEGNRKITVGDCHTGAPAAGQVQIRVSHCGICGTDLHIFHGNMDHRVKMPQVIGHEMSGIVSAAGAGVEGWSEGDRVTVRPLDYCGDCPACRAGHSHICQKLKFIGIDSPGAMQGVWNVPAHTLHRLPANLSLPQGAMIEPVAVACHDVRLGEVKPGEYVVVQGGGPIGALIALVCRNEGANVLVTEVNPHRLQMLAALGVRAVNPAEQDVAALVNDETGAAGADVVFEVTGAPAAAAAMTTLPRTRGRIVMVAIHAKPVNVDLFRFFWRELKLIGARVYEHEDFEKAIALAAAAALPFDRLITSTLPLEGLESGFHQLEGGGNVMKILIDCGGVR
jgi:2-desacetyl-2-hydroxyethyl bacteriochlorophyllide A dehydrogenase